MIARLAIAWPVYGPDLASGVCAGCTATRVPSRDSWPQPWCHGRGASPTKLWWNFIGRSHEEIEAARKDWMETTRFGEVTGYAGTRLPAPELPPVVLKPHGRVR